MVTMTMLSAPKSSSKRSQSPSPDDRAALLAVAPAEDALAAGARVELRLGREPLLEPLGLGERLPDLVRGGGKGDVSLDVQLTGCVL